MEQAFLLIPKYGKVYDNLEYASNNNSLENFSVHLLNIFELCNAIANLYFLFSSKYVCLSKNKYDNTSLYFNLKHSYKANICYNSIHNLYTKTCFMCNLAEGGLNIAKIASKKRYIHFY